MPLCSECPCCHRPLRAGLAAWHYLCPACAYEAADITPAINSGSHPVKPDELEREHGLKVIRQRNFSKILELVGQFCKVDHPRLLDVGCAHGLFLDLVDSSYRAEGIEPHREVAHYTRGKGLSVREGYFPDVLDAGDKYDVIVFNDVLEHIPDMQKVLSACHAALNDGGILVINLPNTSGLLYRISKGLHGFRLKAMFERMWQLHYPSPHLHYFNFENLGRLVAARGFDRVYCGRLETLTRDGLYDRIAHTGEYPLPLAYAIYVMAWLSVPVLGRMPGDIQLQIFCKRTQVHEAA